MASTPVSQENFMLLGCIADDFTGASDLANTLAKQGMATTQFVGIPSDLAPQGCEAGVVALKTRSIPAADAIAESIAALRWLESQGCRQFLFKYCSTFDSTPEGNIGPVTEALLEALGAPGAVLCPVFPTAGRTLFQGHLFVQDRLLNESGMEKHPLNPMTDPDLRRWLRRQSKGEVGFVDHAHVRQGPSAIEAAFGAEVEAGRRLVVIDAITDDDLLVIGAALAEHRLITGGSGIALGLPENFRRAGLLRTGGSQVFTRTKGPGVVLSGSCSNASRGQLAHYLESHPGFGVDPADLMEGRQSASIVANWVLANLANEPVVYSTADPALVAEAQSAFGREVLAARIEAFFSLLAEELVKNGVVRLAVGGGETSGAVVRGLSAASLQIGPEIDPGVPALAITEGSSVRLALKSGNFGSVDFYEKALRMLGEA
jgi:uncharacterized protein YgbK (DUF1537 family)